MTLDELKVLLALHSNTRIEHLEEEIFANDALSVYYIMCIASCECRELNPRTSFAICQYIYRYAYDIIDNRWLAAEQFLKRHPQEFYTNRYYQDIIKHARL